MKLLKLMLVIVGTMAIFFSCKKVDTVVSLSKGSLKSNDTTGDCLPITVWGNYTAGVLLNSSNFIDVDVNITAIGSYVIETDSVNGMLFKGTGRLGYTGINRIRLYSYGKPIAPGITTLTVQFEGTACTVSVPVGGLALGSYLLADTVTSLGTPVVHGTYKVGTQLSVPDSVVLKLDVLRAGAFYLSSNTIDGITFSGSAVFTSPGVHNITLAGTGVPQFADTLHFYVLDSLSDSSQFNVVVAPISGTVAVFTGCSGFSQHGSYQAGVILNAGDSVTTHVTVTKKGTYSIVTEQENGVVFSGTGVFDTTGIFPVTLKGSGTPQNPGAFNYTAIGDSAACPFTISYAIGAAEYTLGGNPGACTMVTVNGTYKTGTPITSNNTVTMQVNVTRIGSYSIITGVSDGISFAANGTFTSVGTQLVTLRASGSLVNPGLQTYTPTARGTSCVFNVNVTQGANSNGKAIFSLGGAPGTCSNYIVRGNYFADTTLNSSNTVTLEVNVAVLGTYTINSGVENGIRFNATGTFTQTGTQSVVLKGSGTPTTATNSYFTFANGTSSTCSFHLITTPAVAPATYTFTSGGTSDTCTGAVLNGTYTAGTGLGAADSVLLNVNVTATGSYNISTSTVDGISFSGSGVFTHTGIQTVTLMGSGTPTLGGANNYPATGNGNTCSFSVTATAPAGTIACKLSNVAKAFNFGATGNNQFPSTLDVTGSVSNASPETIDIHVSKSSGSITTGNYSGSQVTMSYTDASSDTYFASGVTSATVTVTSINSSEAKGTFSGTFTKTSGSGPSNLIITNGSFDVPLQ